MNGVSSRSAAIADLAAGEPERRVAQQRARARGPASARTWKPLQIPRTRPPSAANAGDRAHDRAEPGDDAGPQVVAVGEAAGQDDRRDALEVACSCHRTTGSAPASSQGVERVAVAVAAREDDDADPHAPSSARPPRRDGRRRRAERLDRVRLDERVRQQLARRAGRRSARAAASSAASTVSSTRRPTRTALTPVDPEVAEAALDGPALRIEDAGLGQ